MVFSCHPSGWDQFFGNWDQWIMDQQLTSVTALGTEDYREQLPTGDCHCTLLHFTAIFARANHGSPLRMVPNFGNEDDRNRVILLDLRYVNPGYAAARSLQVIMMRLYRGSCGTAEPLQLVKMSKKKYLDSMTVIIMLVLYMREKIKKRKTPKPPQMHDNY
ncbi:hypothetical protein BDV11DRAFT_38454 [Aspergillus similis]